MPALDFVPPTNHQSASIALRLAAPDDDRVLDRLAALDETSLPAGAVLLGVRDGEPVAALELTTGRMIADPFVATSEVQEVLRRRAAQLADSRPSRLRSAIHHLPSMQRREPSWIG